ncbi:MAG: NAD(P)/FAD-dependent oxidoreductase [Ferruginibacter sp.]
MANHKLVVIGAGAAGFFCAVNAARLYPSLQVLIVEKSSKLLSKVKVSGGGRCNVTHACFSIAEMIKNYPRGNAFLKKAFHHFFTSDTIQWFQDRGVQLKTEADGRMFPVTDSSQTIMNCLLSEANKYKVQIMMNAAVEDIIPGKENHQVVFQNKKKITAGYVCIACGGFSKWEQFNWLSKLGHTIVPPVPSLFTFNIARNSAEKLMGISVPNAQVKIPGTKWEQAGAVLITHWGFSGPAILKLSAFAARELYEKSYNSKININWIGNVSGIKYNENLLNEKLCQLRFENAAQKIYNKNPFQLPARLWEFLLATININSSLRWADLPAKQQNLLSKILCAQEFELKGKTTFKEEFVTAGGIALSEVNASTLESKKQPGIYFAGEILDIDGITGGFNFQNAWTTGFIAAQAIAKAAFNCV